MLDQYSAARLAQIDKRLRTQEAEALGPTLGEFYGNYFGIHRLRAYWPMSSISETPTVLDLSGQGRTLTFNGTVNVSIYNDFVPYLDFNGTTGFLSRADESGLDIVGTLFFGGWFWADTGAAIGALISKWSNVAANQSYALRYTGSNTVQVLIGDGVTAKTLTSTVAFSNDAWHCVFGRYSPSAELAIFVDGIWTKNTSSVPAALVNSAQQLEIGRLNVTNGQFLDGRAGKLAISAAAPSDTFVNYLHARDRVIYGV